MGANVAQRGDMPHSLRIAAPHNAETKGCVKSGNLDLLKITVWIMVNGYSSIAITEVRDASNYTEA